MFDYQSFICSKCGKAVLRSLETRYCQYCGAKLPELKEPPEVVCPICHGTGKVKDQPCIPTPTFFNVTTNEGGKK